ncbi:MAG: LysM peptidoglycan-binding domain-containing protein [Planctomycetes bacterium]|nr:LysM peptidoglycan-binding domain-containing protein [Planctomycetota bacterium]
MGNDLKYGLIFGGVVVLIFIGYLAMRSAGESPAPLPETSEVPLADTDMFAPPEVPEPVPVRPPQTAEIEISPSDVPAAEDVVVPVVPGVEHLIEAPLPAMGEPLPQPAEESFTETRAGKYVISRGDTLQTISKNFYGTTTKWKLIQDANPDAIPNADVLKVGTKIVIPAVPGAALRAQPPVTPSGTAPREAPAGGRIHRVAQGDTLYSIAKQYYGDGNKWKKIYEANKDQLPNANALKVGQELTIP